MSHRLYKVSPEKKGILLLPQLDKLMRPYYGSIGEMYQGKLSRKTENYQQKSTKADQKR